MQLLIIFLSIVLIFTILLLLFLMFRRRLFGGDAYRRKTPGNRLASSFVVHNKSYAPVYTYLTNRVLMRANVLESLGSDLAGILESEHEHSVFPDHFAEFLESTVCELLELAYRYERVDEPIVGTIDNTLFDTANPPDTPSDTLRNEDYCRMMLGYCMERVNQETQPQNVAHMNAYRIQQTTVTVTRTGNTYSFVSIPKHGLEEYQSVTIPGDMRFDIDGYPSNGRVTKYITNDTSKNYILVTHNRRWAVWLTLHLQLICETITPNGIVTHRLTGTYYDSYTTRLTGVNNSTVRVVYSLIMELEDENRTHITVTNGVITNELPYLAYRGIAGDITNIDMRFDEWSYVSRASSSLIYKDEYMSGFPLKFIKILNNNKMLLGRPSLNGGMYLYKMDIQTRAIEARLGHVIRDALGNNIRKNNTVITTATRDSFGNRVIHGVAVYDSNYDEICFIPCQRVSHNYYTGVTTVIIAETDTAITRSFTIDDDGVFGNAQRVTIPTNVPNQTITYGSYLHELSNFIRQRKEEDTFKRIFINYVSVAASVPSTPQSFIDMFDSVVSGKITIDKMHADTSIDMGIVWDYNPHPLKQESTQRSKQIRNARKLIIDLLFDPMVTISINSRSTSMFKYQPKIYRDNRVKDVFITFVPCRDGDTIFPYPYGDEDNSIIFLETDEKQSSNKGAQVFYDALIGAYYTGVPENKRFVNVATFRIHKDARAREIDLNLDMIKHPHFLKSICHFLTIMKLNTDDNAGVTRKEIAYTYV